MMRETIEASTVAANAARLHQGTVRPVTLHDKVHDRQGYEPKREVDQKRTFGPR